MWCLEELGLLYNRIDAGFTYGVVDSEAYLAMNPNGTVPTIRDGENPPLWESGAILRYLADRYADDDFWPSATVDRARVDQWAEWPKGWGKIFLGGYPIRTYIISILRYTDCPQEIRCC